ncbi:MAG: M1 family metallopeptidase [Myxococcota bacterium]
MRLFLLACLFSLSSLSSKAPGGQLPQGVKPLHYDLALSVNPGKTDFSGKATIKLSLAKPIKEFWLHGEDLKITDAYVQTATEQVKVTYEQVTSEGVSQIRAPKTLPAGELTLTLQYTAPYQKDLAGLYRVAFNKLNYVYSQFEPIAARTCFPGFDEPRFKTPFKISLTVPKNSSGISNGLLQQEIKNKDGTKTLLFEETAPLPTYLIAFAVGPFDVVDGPMMGKIPLRGIAPKGQGKNISYALSQTPRILSILEDYFGIPYPYSKLDIIAVPDFAAGAMENAGAITFRDSLLLLNPKTAPVWQVRRFAEVMAHELAHQWFGNLVTLAWWEDIWLNEAFATWIATKVIMQYDPAYQADLEALEETQQAMNADSLASSRKIAEPITSHHDIYSAFDAITYTKGAAVIAMFEEYLGADIFQKGVRNYLVHYANRNADTRDFIAALSKVNGINLSSSFESFLNQPGVPLIHFEKDRYAQKRYLPLGSDLDPDHSWVIPFCPEKTSCQMLGKTQGTLENFGFPARAGKGYYRFSGHYPFNFASASNADKVVQIANLKGAFTSGRLNTSELLPELAKFAKTSSRFTATAPMSTLYWLNNYVIKADTRPHFEAYARKVYTTKPQMLDSNEQKLFDAEYSAFEAEVAKDPAIRKDLLKKALGYLIKPSSLDPDLIKVALTVLIQEMPAYYPRLRSILAKSKDAIQRRAVIGALAESDQSLNLILSKDLRKNEILTLLGTYMKRPEHFEKGLAWMEVNLPALIKSLPIKSTGHLPWTLTALCSAEDANRVNTLLKPFIQTMPGGPRALSGAVEQIKLCAALAESQGENAMRFFNAAGIASTKS